MSCLKRGHAADQCPEVRMQSLKTQMYGLAKLDRKLFFAQPSIFITRLDECMSHLPYATRITKIKQIVQDSRCDRAIEKVSDDPAFGGWDAHSYRVLKKILYISIWGDNYLIQLGAEVTRCEQTADEKFGVFLDRYRDTLATYKQAMEDENLMIQPHSSSIFVHSLLKGLKSRSVYIRAKDWWDDNKDATMDEILTKLKSFKRTLVSSDN
jgi:hypothetical protein